MDMTNSSDMTSHFYPPIAGEAAETQFPHVFLREPTPPLYPQQATVERIDDIPLLWALMQRIHLGTVIDTAIPHHWSHLGLSIGQLVTVWNTFILSEIIARSQYGIG
jgi:hypothetical protein